VAKFLSHGAFADVFDLGDGTVAKVFRRVQQTHSEVQNWDDHEFITRRLYWGELTAYTRLQDRADIVPFIPKYYGPLAIGSLDLQRSRATEPLMADCALQLEFVPGTDIKVANMEEPLLSSAEEILRKISELAGRVDVWDSSCFLPGVRGPFTLIDFAMWEDLGDAQAYLEEHGSIPADVRNVYSLGITVT
jgi:hypothetical protein